MDTIKIEIINPKAAKIIQDLADLDLIIIQKKTKNDFLEVLKKLRMKAASAPTMEEITKEVEIVRNKRYAN